VLAWVLGLVLGSGLVSGSELGLAWALGSVLAWALVCQ